MLPTPDELDEDLASRIEIAFNEFRRDNPDLGDRIANEFLGRACRIVGMDSECRIDDIDNDVCDDEDME